MEQKRCISSLTLAELTDELKALGQPGFRAKQIFHWVHQKLVTEFSAMTDQPKTLLAKLEETFYIAAPQIERRQEAKDGTVKYLLRMADGNCIETVVMRYHYGNTVCVSTQVGCRMGCRFCASTQAAILDTAAALLKAGGRLVYSTCTIDPAENQKQIAAFLQRHPEFAVCAPDVPLPAGMTAGEYGCLSVPTRTGMDGFFLCVLQKATGTQ